MTTWTIRQREGNEYNRFGRYADKDMAELNARLINAALSGADATVEPFEDTRMFNGPLCAYWEEEDASICGHRSCYSIADSWNWLP